jgi:hypothetical protein
VKVAQTNEAVDRVGCVGNVGTFFRVLESHHTGDSCQKNAAAVGFCDAGNRKERTT